MSDTDQQSLPLVQHLIELRNRLLYGLVVLLVIFLMLFPFANDIYIFVSAPLQVFLPESSSMIATEVATPFLAPFKLTFFVAFLIAIPFLLYQLWAFLAPGLYQSEKGLIFPLLVSSVFLFYAGIAFAYSVVFPLIFAFFTSTAPEGVTVMTDIGSYLDFVTKLFIAFGVVFEIPIATILFIRSGVISADELVQKRPYIIIGSFVIGMLLTPPDVISQSLLAIPMWCLFECGVFLGRYLHNKKSIV
ncbi:twin arginine-targeting protein translocase TatC [Candidatus Endobugula sertula]|uniref:Sec-independent protein translocase protein TatC n=1 Tax=Candidatus Endobugula sertula TaxID=62101 RepID=A0A1D2QRD0_9GAMM|nr:twin arginine-targeting protein translocase TatC [Candidatus Endobugula sertula]